MRASAVKAQYQCAVPTSCLVTFIAVYNFIWILNSYICPYYHGELVIIGDAYSRWKCWYIPMVFFLYTVYELLIGLSGATIPETDA